MIATVDRPTRLRAPAADHSLRAWDRVIGQEVLVSCHVYEPLPSFATS
jgi:hypothetical protein